MIRLYSTRLSAVSETALRAEYGRLDGEMRRRIDGMRRTADQERSLAGRILLRRAAEELFGRRDYTVTYGENGKPLVNFCHFSISHAGDVVVCAVSDRPVGADVERLRAFRLRPHYPFFTPRETAFVNRCPAHAGRRFYALWTRKEALLKLRGGRLADAVADALSVPGFAVTTRRCGDYILSVCALPPHP